MNIGAQCVVDGAGGDELSTSTMDPGYRGNQACKKNIKPILRMSHNGR
jgi:hypothetical protein